MFFSRDNLIVLGILVVISVTYFTVIYRVQSVEAGDISSRTVEARHLLEADAVQASRVPPLLRQIEQMKKRYSDKKWEQRLPERQELSGFLREIASGLSKENLTNQYIQSGNPSHGHLYNCLPITLNFEGDFLSLARFLKRIDGMTRLLRIGHLTINLAEAHSFGSAFGEDQARRGNLEIEMGMNIYFTDSRHPSGQRDQTRSD